MESALSLALTCEGLYLRYDVTQRMAVMLKDLGSVDYVVPGRDVHVFRLVGGKY